jgi:hypothetical protein
MGLAPQAEPLVPKTAKRLAFEERMTILLNPKNQEDRTAAEQAEKDSKNPRFTEVKGFVRMQLLPGLEHVQNLIADLLNPATDSKNAARIFDAIVKQLDSVAVLVVTQGTKQRKEDGNRVDPVVDVVTSNAQQKLHQIARNLDLNRGNLAAVSTAEGELKKVVKGIGGLKSVMATEGIADVVKAPGERLRDKDGAPLVEA